MSAPAPATAEATLPVTRTPVRVSITVVVGEAAKSFAAEGVSLDGSDPYRLANHMAGAVRNDVDVYLRDRTNY